MIGAPPPPGSGEPERVGIDLATLGRMVGEHVPVATAATLGPAHVLRWMNSAFCGLVGASAEALIGRPFATAWPVARTDGAIELLDRVLGTGAEASLAESAPTHPRWTYTVAPLFGTQGSPTGLLVGVGAITAPLAREPDATDDLREANRRLLLASLRAEEQVEEAAGEVAHFNALLQSLHEAVTIVDSTGRVLLMNPAAMALFGDAPESPRDLSRLMAARDLRRLDNVPIPPDEWPIARALRGEAFSDEELILVRPDGTHARLLASGSAIRDGGKVVLAIVVHRDVTALRLLEQTKEEYLALISHDLRAPLTAVQAEAQLLERLLGRDGNADSGHVQRTRSIVTNARRMNAMIQELLESSRLESGSMTLKQAPTQIVPLLRDIVARAGSDRVVVQVEPADAEPGLAAVLVDAERIERVLTNLLTNALRYSPPSTPVVVQIQQPRDGETVVSVIDRGEGIPPEELARLFERFTRGRAGPMGDTAGVGLGLYIARLIVEAHGGRMWADSTAGTGSTFAFSLPNGGQ